jgi:hypothetical protein
MHSNIAILRLCMERKAIMSTLGIFSGKQKEYNIQVLTMLYDNEPMTAWEITKKLTDTNKQSLHATLNKRLRDLEKKEYVQKDKYGKWNLRLKGIIANLLIQPKPKMWNPIWSELFTQRLEKVESISAPILGLSDEKIQKYFKFTGLTFDDFKTWIEFTDVAKRLMNNGVINFDIIKESTLMGLLIMEAKTLEDFSTILKPKDS